MKRKGSVLVLVVWMVIFLTAMGLSLGRRIRTAVAFVQRHAQLAQAKGPAWAGVISAIAAVHQNDSRDQQYPDTLYQCGIGPGGDPEKLFHVRAQNGGFDVGYEQDGRVFDGLEDEDRKINLNALHAHNSSFLHHLLRLSGFSDDRAHDAVRNIMKRLDEGRPLETVEELMLIPGIDQDMYQKIKGAVTVYPRSAVALRVNINTASRIVLRALVRGVAEEADVSVETVDHLVDGILSFRAGDDGREGTPDDRPVDLSSVGLDAEEKILAERIKPWITSRAEYLRVRSQGVAGKASVIFEAVIYRPQLTIVSWQRK